MERMEESVIQKEPILPAPFGTVRNPVSMMEHEHDSAGNALRALRASSHGYTTPPDACVSFQTLYKTLRNLRRICTSTFTLKTTFCFPGNCSRKCTLTGDRTDVRIADAN